MEETKRENQKNLFYRIERLPPYVFEEVNRLKAEARAKGEDIIDFGMGNPDMPTPEPIVKKLIETVGKPRTNRYSASRGIIGLRRAQAAYYKRRFGVALNPDSEIVVTLGSKEGFINMAQAITSPGSVVLVPDPSYPIHSFGFILAGASVRRFPLGAGEDFQDAFLRDIDRAAANISPPPLALVCNFPCNPTAQTADADFYKELVALAKKRGFFILSDLAYAEIYFNPNAPPPSILEVAGAKDVSVEFTSMSKTYAMPGWRIGFAVGNERLIHALARVKSYVDYGAFTPIQVASAEALNGPQDCVEEIRGIYKARRDILTDSFARAGWRIPPPSATMFAWAPLPENFRAMGSLAFSRMILKEAGIAVSPGAGFGDGGDGFVRVSLVENPQRIRQAARSFRNLMKARGAKGAAREGRGARSDQTDKASAH